MNSITYDERKIVYQKALDKFGANAQITKAVEEMSELTKELCKYSLGAGDREALADEIADVTIMLEQLRLIFDVNDEVCRHMDAKVERLQDRIDKAGQSKNNELKVRFKHARGRVVAEYKSDDSTLEEVIDLLKDDAVISLSVVKMTPAQYLRTQPAFNDEVAHGK